MSSRSAPSGPSRLGPAPAPPLSRPRPVSPNQRRRPAVGAGSFPARRFRFLGAAAMAPPWFLCRAQLSVLLLALLGLAAAAGPRQTPALELAEELAEELWSAGLPGDLPELEPECRSLLAAFAEGSAALTGCLGRRARPVRLCQGCHGHYRRLLAQYGSIARAVGVRPWGRGGCVAAGAGWGPGPFSLRLPGL